jgi:hypothetical protein
MAQGKEKEAKALMAFQSQMQAIGPELGQGARDLASGAANTDAARKLLASTGGAAQDIISQITSGNIDQYEAAKQMQAASRSTGDAARENARFVDKSNSAFLDFSQQMDLNNAQLVEGRGLVKKVQNEQTKGGDKMTDATVSAQQNLEQMNRRMAQLGFQLMPHAAVAIEKFTASLNDFLGWMGEKLGIDMPGTKKTSATSAGGAAGTMDGFSTGSGGVDQTGAGAGTAQLTAKEAGVEGLKVKSAEAYSGGASSDGLIGLAHRIQEALGPDLKYFSGFNDSRPNDGKSKHGKGLALDVVLNDPEKYASALSTIKGMTGVSFAQFEEGGQRNANGSVASGAHIHAEVSAANGFNGMISGPSSGYRPNLTMHGTEQISIQPNPNTGSSSPNSDSSIMSQQLAKLDELVSVMKSQVSISSKLLSYSS